jgi:hypothetical protein
MRQWWFRLLALLFLLEMFTPFLQWPIGLPGAITVGMEGAAALIAFFTFTFMMKENKIPQVVLLILGITFIWGIVSVFEGQSPAALVWGWWRFFKYPLAGLFAYLVIDSPKDFAKWFFKFCLALLAFQVGVQLVMYAMGFPISDELAGTFGWKGVMQFTMMVFFIVCMGMGYWLATGNWKPLLFVLVLGLVGSTLNATKFYLIAAAGLAVTTLVIHMVRGGQYRQLFKYVILFSVAAAVFVPLYNSFLVNTQGLRPLQEYLEPEAINRYLFSDGKGDVDGRYDLGRGIAVTYVWQQITRDATSTLFGYGLGARSGSAKLGISGRGLEEDVYGGVGTTTLSTWMFEYGLVGLAVFLCFSLWISVKLFRFARVTDDPYQAALAYGLILFTLFWPVWLWYHKAWTGSVMMILYWVSLAFTFRQIYPNRRVKTPVARQAVRAGR